MPGKIVKINVAAGDRVTDGDTLIVFEAMKMQSNLKVVGDCTVREVLVCEGDPGRYGPTADKTRYFNQRPKQ